MSPTLSVLVISHNQRFQVQRCLDSILSQNLPFEYEIIISDDISSDGTWELEQEYEARYSFIKLFQCNSNDCNPTITSERSGYNRSNAYAHSSGKYFVHIDADDWYRPGTDCLARQVELLDQHPECSMCMQGEWDWKEGDNLETGRSNPSFHKFKTGEVISADIYYRANILLNNGAMMMRRTSHNPSIILNKWYVDSIITAYFLSFGPIVCLDKNDWIYTQSPATITNAIRKNDSIVLWGLCQSVICAGFVPSLKCNFYSSSYLITLLLDSVRAILNRAVISKECIDYCHQFNNIFICRVVGVSRLHFIQRARLEALKASLKLMKNRNLFKNKTICKLLHFISTK